MPRQLNPAARTAAVAAANPRCAPVAWRPPTLQPLRTLRSPWPLPLWLSLLLVLVAPAPARSADAEMDQLDQVQVTDPYLELRTGPGRYFPITTVAERNDWIGIELRHTDWFKVRTAAGKEGWVDRRQLENTLTAAGSKKTFRDVMLDDYLSRRVEFGAAYGRFRSEPMLKLWGSYNLSDPIAVEATVGQVQGIYSGTNFWHVDLLVQPWSDRRLAPFFGVGLGKLTNFPNASLVSASNINAKTANAMLGVRYHLSERFVARLDWTIYTAFVDSSHIDEFRATTAGLAFFF